jgi:hypothetical protein
VVFYQNGTAVKEETMAHYPTQGTREYELPIDACFEVSQGTYRVEVYRDDLGSPFDKMPWIISNPIYVR